MTLLSESDVKKQGMDAAVVHNPSKRPLGVLPHTGPHAMLRAAPLPRARFGAAAPCALLGLQTRP